MLRTYDFRLKLDAINDTIPDEYKPMIKPFMIYKWKKEKWDKLVGFDYYNKQNTETSILLKEIYSLKEDFKKLQAEKELLLLINNSVSDSQEFGRLVHKNKKDIMTCVERNKKLFGVKQSAQLLHINPKTYYEWISIAKAECQFSRRFVCIKRRPNQLSMDEELKIIQLLQDPLYAHYPLSSLYWKAHHEGIVHASMNTWRKLQKLYKIERLKPKKQIKYYYKSLKAEYVNQYLHADITYFKVKGGKTYYIYIVKDNYSKYITSWAISDTINAHTRIKTFDDSLSQILDSNLKVSFIADQGNENRNKKVDAFFKKLKNADIKYARIDIPYSNSMIERFNHDLKYMYLYREYISTLKELTTIVELAVKEHNYTKRMECLQGQTPYEVYLGIPSRNEQISDLWKKAVKYRNIKVKNTICCIN